MPKRNAQWRRRAIIDRLHEQGEVSVESLAECFQTSEVTIRKDLTALETSGLLLRRYGGAVPLPSDLVPDDTPGSVQKQTIARLAAELIRDHNRIIIDSGHTTAALLPHLSARRGLVVMTNALAVANQLLELENEPTLLMTGGTWDARSEAFQGQLAEQILRSYDFDQLFIGADGLDIERGTTTFNELYSLSRVMADTARQVVVMAESDKLGRRIHNVELPWAQVDILVTDEGLPDSAAREIESNGVRVIRPANNL
ncbi:DeoR/GlpR family DNA-binding transcription regulator [Gilvimarinus xylanilyticus]|uniref:DeoR family transcriptional regulator n=1 Tax=Gilvimarinus xylanilyticus TaxID=2944139 RepID=A0A9X2HYP6_9GAMM|nr:DeoR family transcriptional regulator [Gilvimarinus xylanilyticus]MCP8900475.1 DeoR family transcriptional regulator [Gilvimarinus xylanilyticus]